MEHLRTSDGERQRVADFLRDCCAEGYLDVDELDERQSGVLHSRTRGELEALVRDMPGAHAVLPGEAVATPLTFVRRPRRASRVTSVLVTLLALLVMMVLVSVPVFELLGLGVLAGLVGMFALVVLITLSPWLAAGALVAWSVNRLRQPPPPHQG